MKRYHGVKPAMVVKSNYVHQFDSLPDGGSIGTAAPGDDDNIWSARELHPFPYSPHAVARGTLQGKGTPAIGEAHEATDDSALIEPLVLTAKCLVAQLGQFKETINEFDRKIRGDCTKRISVNGILSVSCSHPITAFKSWTAWEHSLRFKYRATPRLDEIRSFHELPFSAKKPHILALGR